ncbi:MAG: aromatic acid exporter family protein [Lachnospiraceae bacterium]
MKKEIWYAIRIITAATAAILLARTLSLQFDISAGIVAILSVASTKRETIKTAYNRFIAFGVALLIAFFAFSLFGYGIEAFLVYLAIFVLICQFCGWTNAMAMDSVLISHFLTFGEMNIESLMNELLLFVIGAGTGILVNLCLRNNKFYMKKLKAETDELIRKSLFRMSQRILDDQFPDYDGTCFDEMRQQINQALLVARENYMNQLVKENTADIEYINMRSNQVELLYEMYKKVRDIHTTPVTAKILSEYFLLVANEYAEENTVTELLDGFYRMRDDMKRQVLPGTREEFEDRAKLYGLMQNMEEFLLLKKDYCNKYRENSSIRRLFY